MSRKIKIYILLLGFISIVLILGCSSSLLNKENNINNYLIYNYFSYKNVESQKFFILPNYKITIETKGLNPTKMEDIDYDKVYDIVLTSIKKEIKRLNGEIPFSYKKVKEEDLDSLCKFIDFSLNTLSKEKNKLEKNEGLETLKNNFNIGYIIYVKKVEIKIKNYPYKTGRNYNNQLVIGKFTLALIDLSSNKIIKYGIITRGREVLDNFYSIISLLSKDIFYSFIID